MARNLGTVTLGLSSEIGFPPVGGVDAALLSFPTFGPGEALRLKPQPEADDTLLTWAIGLDLYIPQPTGAFTALVQTGDGDGELFLRDNGDGTAGLGIDGVYDGAVPYDAWSRVVATFTQEDGSTILRKYVNGTLVGEQDLGATTRWGIDPAVGLSLLTDNDGETTAGALASVFFTTDVPGLAETAAALASVPLPSAAGFFPAQPSAAAIEITFEGDDVAPRYGDATVSLDGFGYRNAAEFGESAVALASQFGIEGPGGADIPVLNYAAFGADEGLKIDLPGADLPSYTAIWDIRVDSLPGFQSLIQTDPGQANDGELFIRSDGGIGIGGNYDGAVVPGTWHRIAVAVEDQGDGTAILSKYLDGAFLDAQTVDAARFTLDAGTGAVLLSDNDGETGSGYLAHFGLSDAVLDADAIAALGGADGVGPFTAGVPGAYQLGFDGYAPAVEFGFSAVELLEPAPQETSAQDNISDLLIRDDGTPSEIDLAAAFGPDASGFVVTTADGTVLDAAIDGTTLSLSALKLGHSDITVTAQTPAGQAVENFRAIVAGENAYVFAIMPDTQDYTSNPGIAETFGNMADWLLAQKDGLAIEHMIHVGDIVQFGAAGQWEIARDAISRLDGELSYTLAVGNHDQQRPGFSSAFSFETDVDAYFTPEQVGATAAQGGGTYDGVDVGEDTFGNGSSYADSIRNHYTTLETRDGAKWLIFSLEFGMPDDVLRWAGEVIEDHLDHRVIIDTHSWNGGDGRVTPTTQPLNTDNGGWGYGIRENPRNVNDGEEAWREFASKYPNITFTFNGHNFMGGAETVVSYGAGGNPVFQTFVNYQNGAWAGPDGVGPNGGNGALRLMVIDPDNDRITTHTKLTELDTYFEEFPDHQEVFEGVDLGAPEGIVIAKAGELQIVTGDGVSGTVELDPGASLGTTEGARFEWFDADGEKLGESDGAPIEVELPTGTTRITLKVTDASGNVSTDETVAIVDGPDTLLTETFDDGDLAGWGAPAGDPGALAQLGTDLSFALPSIGGTEQILLTLRFDSSFRPYDDMTGEVLVSFDDGASFTTLLTLDTSTVPGGSSSLARVNETVELETLAPSSAATAQFAFRLSQGGNDWWWAIDNVGVEALTGSGPVELLSQGFDALDLQSAVDESIDPGLLGWTPTAPDGWDVENAALMPQGTAEWQGWTFATPEFWTTADGQNRGDFTLGTGVIAIADPDEWDDFGTGAGGGDFDSLLRTPGVDLTSVGGGQAAGSEAGVAGIAGLAPDEAILFRPEGLTGAQDSYTLVFDILLPETAQSFTSLFQTDVTNGGDSEIYLRNDGGTASIGISGDYDGALSYGGWGRLALVFGTDSSGAQTVAKYLDGVLLDTQVVDSDVSDGSRWSIDGEDGLLLFSEGAGFTSEIFVNSLYFAPEALDAATISGFGEVDVDGPADGSLVAGDVQLSFDGALDAVDFGAAEVRPLSLASPDATSYLVKGSIFGNPDGAGEAALYQQSNQADQHLIWLDEAARGWSDYVLQMEVEPADNDTIGALFYYVDETTHYKLAIDQQNDTRELIRVEDGEETVLATQAGGYRHFAKQDLSIAVLDGTITVTLDDELLFDGPVTDPDPLAGGTVGITSSSMDRVEYDNITVNPITLAARALTEIPSGRWETDLDGDGTALVTLTAAASLSAAGIASQDWLVDGEVLATGRTAALNLAPGETTVTLRVTDANGAVSEDQVTVDVADARAVLLAENFADGDAAGWSFVDEGTIDGPSNWQVSDGALIQASNISSAQQGTGSAAYSVAGDGPYILRDGTYAIWDDPAAQNWSDYAVEATITPNDDDGIGLLFRYSDADNYYKVETDAQTGIAMLTRHLEGRETILARGYVGYTPGEEQHWRIEAEGGVLTPYINGKAVFGTIIEDRALPAGTVGLYGWASEDLAFDDIRVIDLGYEAPTVNVVLGTDGSDNLLGTDGQDAIFGLGGPYDRMTGGADADQFVFGAAADNGSRERAVILDFEVGLDQIVLEAGAAVTRIRESGSQILVQLEGDGDVIYVRGRDLSAEDLTFVTEDGLWV